MTTDEPQSHFLHDTPPLLPTLTSSKYHIKWTQLSDLPVPLCGAHIAVQDRKIYVTGGISPIRNAAHQVFIYELDNDRWGRLPTPDHYYAIPHIIGGKLTLIGGRLIATNKRTNKVSTFDQAKQSWVSHYPNLLSVISLPGVVTHMEYAIVAGGARGEDIPVIQDDIEILNWVENVQWKRASVCLPVPMYELKLAISNNTIFVVGHINADIFFDKHIYELPVAVITNSADQHCTSTRWVELGETAHWHSCLVTGHGLSPLMVVGGYDATDTTEDIMMYNISTQDWKKIDSLSFARCRAAATMINDNAIVVAGGCTSISDVESTILTVVELGQVEEL